MVPRGLALLLAATAVTTLAVGGQARSGVPDPPPLGGGGGGLLAPVVVTGAHDDLDETTAAVTALVTPNGSATTAFFDYGPTPAYGRRTGDLAVGAGLVPAVVGAQLTELQPGSVVHYRAVAANAAGTSAGGDRVLVTPSPGQALPPPADPGAAGGTVAGMLGGGGTPGGPTAGGRTEAAVSVDTSPALGRPTTLAVRARDPGAAVTALEVDFGEAGGRLIESACEEGGARTRTGALRVGREEAFAVTYGYRTTGRHRVTVDLFSGTCNRPPRRLRRLVTVVDVQAGARAAQAPARAACPDADTLPTARNDRRLERALRCLVAVERSAQGLGPLRPSRKLTTAARGHARDMLRRRYLAHSHPRGPTLGRRLARVGYQGRGGETLAVGAGRLATPRAIVESWMNSSVHREVLLRPRYRAIGAAVRRGAPVRVGPPRVTVVANLGTRR